jgi:hypothetical protein
MALDRRYRPAAGRPKPGGNMRRSAYLGALHPWWLLAACLSLAVPISSWADLPEFARYQVPFGLPPPSAAAAVSTMTARAGSVIAWNACGREIDFFVSDGRRDAEGKRGGDIYPVIAKIAWLPQTVNITGLSFVEPPNCEATVRYFDNPDIGTWVNLPKPEAEHGANHIYATILTWPPNAGFGAADPTALWNAAFEWRWGAECKSILTKVTPESPSGGLQPYLLTFSVSRKCMLAQINAALYSREKIGNPGTSGLPCTFVGTAGPGDWDMAVIALLRAVYVDINSGAGAISAPTGEHIFSQLLTISGPLESPSYGLHECGNTENDTGSPQERSDEDDFYDNDFFRELGDIFEWLLKWLVVVVIVAFALSLGVLLVGPVVIPAVGIPAAVVIITATQVRIPETENHLLMINTSRYLTNQLRISRLTDEDDIEDVKDYQAGVKEWLLQRLQQIAREDFMEYNAKPYQRLSIGAILNLHDFAADDDLKQAARIVLDYSAAKFAAGSNQGRRVVPFRRLMETNRFEIHGPNDEAMKPRRMTDFGSGADHQVAAMLLFTGQTQQLPAEKLLLPGAQTVGGGQVVISSVQVVDGQRWISAEMAAEMIWEATSAYRPHELIIELAIDKSTPYDQRIHHGGFEIYSSGKGYLITAGGTVTPNALGMAFTPLQLNVPPPFGLFQKNADKGSGVPTTLMVPSGRGKLNRNDFIRFEGVQDELSHPDRDSAISDSACETDPGQAGGPKCSRNLTRDHNLCVHRGFACGLNLTVPAALEKTDGTGCVRRLPSTNPAWSFIDSTSCPEFADAPPFYVVLFRRPCPPGSQACKTVWGFLEAVDRPVADPDLTFTQFMEQTISRNPPTLTPSPPAMAGEYNSWRGERISYSALGHAQDNDSSGIIAINDGTQGDIDDWKLASGAAITADGEGRITIRSPGRTPAPGRIMRIRMDFTDWEHPVWEALP